MPESFPFIGGAYLARSKDLNAQVCQNLYVETDRTGAKNIIALVGCPGMKEWLAIGPGAEVRGFALHKQYLYVVIGNTIYQVGEDKNWTSIGTIGTSSGFVDMHSDGVYLGVFDSTGGWYIQTTSMSAISGEPIPTGATYQDGYHIVSAKNTGEFNISAQDDITDWDVLDFADAEGDGDNLVTPVSVERQLWLIGEKTTEVWYNAGTTFPFERNPGGFMRIGCNSKRSIATFEDDLMFLDNNNRVVRKNGLRLEPVSPYQIDYLISKLGDAQSSFMYSQEGHIFYELSFKAKTICYDLTTGFWHTRASGPKDSRSRANCAVRFNDLILVGDYQNGKIYEYSLSTYQDDGKTKRAIRACQFLHENDKYIFPGSLTLDMETSHTAGQIALQVSKNGGHTYGTERWESMGEGYGKRVKWNRLGAARNFAFQVTISDNVKRNINRAYLGGSVGKD